VKSEFATNGKAIGSEAVVTDYIVTVLELYVKSQAF